MKVYHYTTIQNAYRILESGRFTLSPASTSSGDAKACEDCGARYYISFTTEKDFDKGYQGRMRAPLNTALDPEKESLEYIKLFQDKGTISPSYIDDYRQAKQSGRSGKRPVAGEGMPDLIIRFILDTDNLQGWKGTQAIVPDFDIRKYSESAKFVDEKEVRLFSNLPVCVNFPNYIDRVDFYDEKLGTTYDEKVKQRHAYWYIKLEKLCAKYGIGIVQLKAIPSSNGKLMIFPVDLQKEKIYRGNLDQNARKHVPSELGARPGHGGIYNISEKVGKLLGNIFGTLGYTEKDSNRIQRLIENLLEPYCSMEELDQIIDITMNSLSSAKIPGTEYRYLTNTRSVSGREKAVAKALEELVHTLTGGRRDLYDILGSLQESKKYSHLRALRREFTEASYPAQFTMFLREVLNGPLGAYDDDEEVSLEDYQVGEVDSYKIYFFPTVNAEIVEMVKQAYRETLPLSNYPEALVTNGIENIVLESGKRQRFHMIPWANVSDKGLNILRQASSVLSKYYPVDSNSVGQRMLEKVYDKGGIQVYVFGPKISGPIKLSWGTEIYDLKDFRHPDYYYRFFDVQGHRFRVYIGDTVGPSGLIYRIRSLVENIPAFRDFSKESLQQMLELGRAVESPECIKQYCPSPGIFSKHGSKLMDMCDRYLEAVHGSSFAKNEFEYEGFLLTLKSADQFKSASWTGFFEYVNGNPKTNIISKTDGTGRTQVGGNRVDLYTVPADTPDISLKVLLHFYREGILKDSDFDDGCLAYLKACLHGKFVGTIDIMPVYSMDNKLYTVFASSRKKKVGGLSNFTPVVFLDKEKGDFYEVPSSRDPWGKKSTPYKKSTLKNVLDSKGLQELKDILEKEHIKLGPALQNTFGNGSNVNKSIATVLKDFDEAGKLGNISITYKTATGKVTKLNKDQGIELKWEDIKPSLIISSAKVVNQIESIPQSKVDNVYLWINQGTWNCVILVKDDKGTPIKLVRRSGNSGMSAVWSIKDLGK